MNVIDLLKQPIEKELAEVVENITQIQSSLNPDVQTSPTSIKSGIPAFLGTLTGTVDITLALQMPNKANDFYLTFDTGDTLPTIIFPNTITKWGGNAIKTENNIDIPDVKVNKHYEVGVLNNIAIIMEI